MTVAAKKINVNTVGSTASNELTIHLTNSYAQPCCMPEDIKKQKQENAPELKEVFMDTVVNRLNVNEVNWMGEGEVELSGVSNKELHGLILKAEELGKSISYKKTLSVKISD